MSGGSDERGVPSLLDVVFLEPVTSVAGVLPSVCPLFQTCLPCLESGAYHADVDGRQEAVPRHSPLKNHTGLSCGAHKRSQPQRPSPIPQLPFPHHAQVVLLSPLKRNLRTQRRA